MTEIKNILIKMITSLAGGISSKIVIGAITYVILTISLIVLMFVNSEFPGLSSILTTLIVTSGALLGLTTVENIRQYNKKEENKKDNQQ